MNARRETRVRHQHLFKLRKRKESEDNKCPAVLQRFASADVLEGHISLLLERWPWRARVTDG